MRRFLLRLFALSAATYPLVGQVNDPVPGGIPTEGLAIELVDMFSFPELDGGTTGIRLNMLRPVPDNSDRLFVNDLDGRLYVIDGNSTAVFLDVDAAFNRFVNSPGLGTGFGAFDFHPEFATNGKFYTGHSESAGSGSADLEGSEGLTPVQQGVVTEWTMSDPTSNNASGATRREILRIDYSDTVHALQDIHFNPYVEPGDEDYGLLFITTGDSGSVNDDTPENTGHIGSPMGSVLRIDPLGDNSANGEYGIPATNPWVGVSGAVEELYALGFRNPHRISWDSVTGKMFAGNIGERQLEEIELVEKGRHYGWPYREGTFLFDYTDADNVYPLPNPDDPAYTYPVVQYDHDEGFAIIGGISYRGAAIPELYGTYLFGENVRGRIFYSYIDEMNLGSQAAMYELTITRNGNPTSLNSVVGASRGDHRFGYDNSGEMYLVTKQDGWVRKIVRSTGVVTDPSIDDPTAFTNVNDFESGTTSGIFLSQTNSSTSNHIGVSSDPSGDPANQVFVASATVQENTLFASTPIPAIDPDETGTVYIRFAVEDFAKDSVFGVSDVANPTEYTHYEAALRSAADDGLDVRRGSSYEEVISSIATQTWYETWLVVDNTTDTYSFYIKGGIFNDVTLIETGIEFRNGTSSPIDHYLWVLNSTDGKGIGTVYFDDLYVDNDDINLASPIPDAWILLDDFQSDVDDWAFVDLDNQTSPPIPNPQVVELVDEIDGNTYLSRKAAPDGVGGNRRAMAYVPLPFNIPVSGVATLYMQFNAESFPANHVFGVTNRDGPTIESEQYNAFEAILRASDVQTSDGTLEVYDASGYEKISNPATNTIANPMATNTWYETWMVINNGGKASGGQTYDVYVRGGPQFPEQTLVYENAGFRNDRENTLTHFLAISNAGADSTTNFYGTGALLWDNLFVFPGEELSAPVSLVIDPPDPTITYIPISLTKVSGGLEISFDSSIGSTYQLESSDDLEIWGDFKSPLVGTGSTLTIQVLYSEVDDTSTFFRGKEITP